MQPLIMKTAAGGKRIATYQTRAPRQRGERVDKSVRGTYNDEQDITTSDHGCALMGIVYCLGRRKRLEVFAGLTLIATNASTSLLLCSLSCER